MTLEQAAKLRKIYGKDILLGIDEVSGKINVISPLTHVPSNHKGETYKLITTIERELT